MGECFCCFDPTENFLQPCGHFMCTKCVQKWFHHTEKAKCPLCTQNTIGCCSIVHSCLHDNYLSGNLRVATHSLGTMIVCVDEVARKTSPFKNGDVISCINGIHRPNPNIVLDIIRECRCSEVNVTIEIQRKGCSNLFGLARSLRV